MPQSLHQSDVVVIHYYSPCRCGSYTLPQSLQQSDCGSNTLLQPVQQSDVVVIHYDTSCSSKMLYITTVGAPVTCCTVPKYLLKVVLLFNDMETMGSLLCQKRKEKKKKQ